jgi:hypothetical protein
VLQLAAPIAHLVRTARPEQAVFLTTLELNERDMPGASAPDNVVSLKHALYLELMFKKIWSPTRSQE